MVDRQIARAIDEEIEARRKLLEEIPPTVRSRVVTLKAYPDEVVARIQQIDGVIVEFQERR